jgi:hypothetical protein
MNAIAPITAAPEPPLAELPDTLLNFIARAMTDPAINVDKLEVLLRMQREIIAEAARCQFVSAMGLVQGEIQQIARTTPNSVTNSKYATLEAIDAEIRPIYTRHGFTLEFDEPPDDGPNVRLACHVTHTPSGHVVTRHLSAAADTVGPKGTANKTAVQGVGSAVSYLRRYLTCMVFNIVLRGEDNDGNRATARGTDGRITEAQANELHALMDRGRIREGTVIEKMAPGLRSITQLPAVDYPRIKNALLSRINVLAQRAASSTNQK